MVHASLATADNEGSETDPCIQSRDPNVFGREIHIDNGGWPAKLADEEHRSYFLPGFCCGFAVALVLVLGGVWQMRASSLLDPKVAHPDILPQPPPNSLNDDTVDMPASPAPDSTTEEKKETTSVTQSIIEERKETTSVTQRIGVETSVAKTTGTSSGQKCMISAESKDGMGHQIEAKISCIAVAASLSMEYVHIPSFFAEHSASGKSLESFFNLGNKHRVFNKTTMKKKSRFRGKRFDGNCGERGSYTLPPSRLRDWQTHPETCNPNYVWVDDNCWEIFWCNTTRSTWYTLAALTAISFSILSVENISYLTQALT